MKKIALSLTGIAAATAVGIAAWNHTVLQQPLNAAMAEDSRNAGLMARAHFASYVQPKEVVFDLRTVSADKAPVDVFRLFLQFAERLQDRRFDRVVLAYRGVAKFQVEGAYFQQLGREYSIQNPAYTMRTFPQHLLRPDGSQAFGEWSGGVLGVLKEQMEDFAEFHGQWYLNEMIDDS